MLQDLSSSRLWFPELASGDGKKQGPHTDIFPTAHVAMFGVLWFVTLTGVGVALRRPSSTDVAEPPESRVLAPGVDG